MIDPTFLADLRRRYNAQDLLLWVQLEQLAPIWWPNQVEMAEQLGIQASTLSRSLHRLKARDLIRGHGSKDGTHIWWVRRTADGKPDESLAPAWVLRRLSTGNLERVPLGTEREWCQRRGIPYRTFQLLIRGQTRVMRRRFELAGNPWDCEDV